MSSSRYQALKKILLKKRLEAAIHADKKELGQNRRYEMRMMTKSRRPVVWDFQEDPKPQPLAVRISSEIISAFVGICVAAFFMFIALPLVAAILTSL